MSTFIRQRVIATVASLLACAAAVAAPVDVELRPRISARDRQVVLGDVAYLRTTDLASMQRLVSLPLGPAPRAGRDAVLDRATLQRWIRLRLGFAAGELRWAGADYAVVRGTSGAGGVVDAGDVGSSDVLVARGDWVTLRVLSGPVRLEARAEALQAGDAGQVVRVRMAGATQAIDARVLARGSVEAMP